MAVDPLIELRNVNTHHGNLHVLGDTDLTAGEGEAVVVTGPSGPGRPTLRTTVDRSAAVRSGTVPLDGRPLPEEGEDLAPPSPSSRRSPPPARASASRP